jgi:protein TonB
MPAPKKNDPVVEDGTVEDSSLDFVEPEPAPEPEAVVEPEPEPEPVVEAYDSNSRFDPPQPVAVENKEQSTVVRLKNGQVISIA